MGTFRFLFFFSCLCLGSFLLLPSALFSQNTNDSLYYHYNAILHPQNPDALPAGISFYNGHTNTALAKQDTLGALEGLRMMAIGQYKIGDIYESEATAVQALELIDLNAHKDTLIDARVGLYNQLGRIYSSLKDYPEAINALQQALQITPKANDSITLLNNMANIYTEGGQYGQGLQQYRFVYQMPGTQNNPRRQAMVLDNIGNVLARQKAPGALDTLLKALEIREGLDDLSGRYASYKSLALYYFEQGDRTTALTYGQQALATAQTINSAAFRYDALELLMGINPDPQVTQYKRLTDSLATARQLAENKNAHMKYNLGEERKKTSLQALQKEKEKRAKQLFQLSTFFILVLLVLSFFVFRYRYKKGKLETMYKTESRISKKVHDELANEVFHTLAYAENKNLGTAKEKELLLQRLDRIYGKTRDISKDTAEIDTGPAFPIHLKEFLASYSTQNSNVIIQELDSIPWAQVGGLKKMACFRVLQELMVNMKKHSGASLVLIRFAKEGRQLVISYSDNGKGISPQAPLKRGGLQNAETRMQAVKGTFTFDSRKDKGLGARLSFPL
jgi:signal transduction histidine kinase